MKRENAAKRGSSVIRNVSRQTDIAVNVAHATSFLARGRGLMLKSDFPDGSAMVIEPCSSIHMFFMKFPIDVIYLDSQDRVVRTQHGIRPWRVGPLRTKGAKYVIELPSGTIARTQTQPGDQITYL